MVFFFEGGRLFMISVYGWGLSPNCSGLEEMIDNFAHDYLLKFTQTPTARRLRYDGSSVLINGWASSVERGIQAIQFSSK
jgi:hypothetical protein